MNNKIKYLEDNQIPYTLIIYKPTKNHFKLQIKIKDNQVVITSPNTFSIVAVSEIVIKHAKWIDKHLKSSYTPLFKDNDIYYYLGKPYNLKIYLSKYNQLIIDEDNVVIYAKDLTNAYLKALVKNHMLKKAELIFNELLYKTFKRMENDLDKYPQLIIKDYKSKWGLCYYTKNTICLSLRLIHQPLEVIEYVIIHELAHFVYHNHQVGFHNLVNKYCDEKKLRKKLREIPSNY